MNKLIRNTLAFAAAAQMVIAGASSASAQSNLDCLGAVSNITVFNVLVQPGDNCSLTNVTVLGNVEVKDALVDPVTGEIIRTVLTVSGGSIAGSVIAEAESNVSLSGGSVAGEILGKQANSVSVSGVNNPGGIIAEETAALVVSGTTTTKIEALKGGSATITGNTINGGIKFEELIGAVSASGNSVNGNFEAYKNIGGADFTNNSSTGNMQCKENDPAPTGSGNTATSKEDQCAGL
jgi:predicted aconitase with swiveling domain